MAAIFRRRAARRCRRRDRRFRREKQQLAELENEIRALLDLVANRWKALQIAGPRERVVVRHLMKPLVRHHRREQTSVLPLPISQRSYDFSLAPRPQSGLGIRCQVRSARRADSPVLKLRSTTERPIDVVSRICGMTPSADRHVPHDGLAARSENDRVAGYWH